jgi:hypothetical protein
VKVGAMQSWLEKIRNRPEVGCVEFSEYPPPAHVALLSISIIVVLRHNDPIPGGMTVSLKIRS